MKENDQQLLEFSDSEEGSTQSADQTASSGEDEDNKESEMEKGDEHVSKSCKWDAH